MRRLQQICAQLPIADRTDFESHAFMEYSDVSAVNMLGTVLKASEMINTLAEDFKLFTQSMGAGGGYMHGEGGMPNEDTEMMEQFMQSQGKHKKGGIAGIIHKIF
jgi:hypothetical protein